MGNIGKPKGLPKSGGRSSGTPNKRTLDAQERARELGCDPFEVLLKYAKGDWQGLGYDSETYISESKDGQGSLKVGYTISPELRCKAAEKACEYLYPKRKALELSNPEDSEGFAIVIRDYTKAAK